MLRLALMTLLSMLVSSKRMPERDWQTEFHARLFKRFFKTAQTKGPEWSRKLIDSQGTKSKSPVLEKVSIDKLELAGVSGLVFNPQSLNAESNNIVVYLHGGGYVTGSPTAYIPFLARIAVESGLQVYAPDYRLSPEYPFPKPQQDCYAFVQAIVENHPDKKLILMGDSAGGALSIATYLHGGTQSNIAGLALISPWVDPTDMSGSMQTNLPNDMFEHEFLVASYQAHLNGADPENTQTNFAKADLSGLPKTLVQVAGGEVFFDQGVNFAERAKHAGVEVETHVFPTQFHVFQTLAHGFEESKIARKQLVDFALNA